MVAVAFLLHSLGRPSQTFGTNILHGQKAEGLCKCDAIGSGMKKFDVRAHLAEHSFQRDVARRTTGDRTFGEHGRASGKGQALQHANKARIVNREQSTLIVRDADAWRAWL